MTIDSAGTGLPGRRMYWALGVLIMITAVGLRVYAIDRLPPGLFGDEAVEGLDALDVLAGNWSIWFHAHLGREPIYVYLVALSYSLFGVSPLSTRLPAVIAGIATIPAAFLLTREWARQTFGHERSVRISIIATALLAISFWHIQMSRDAHRDTLLPLVESLGFWLFWRGTRASRWRLLAAAGVILGLAVYTYSPGRFVGVLVVTFVVLEFVASRLGLHSLRFPDRGLFAAAAFAIIIMLPLGAYFLQNPAQFSRRFESVSIFDSESPTSAFVASVSGNLAQFVVPGAGYQSKHYNLPGKPVFDLLIVAWFLAGVAISIARVRQPAYRFLLLWFVVMLFPAFLTADMIPKGVRAFGTVPGVFIFPALAMDALIDRVRIRRLAAVGIVGLFVAGSFIWSAYDYFVSWANLPELPLAFDADMTEVSEYIKSQSMDSRIYVSSKVYRPPTEMLLGRHVPTTRYIGPATRIKEFDAQVTLIANSTDRETPFIFVGDSAPPGAWLERIAPQATMISQGKYINVWRLGEVVPPQRQVQPEFSAFNPLLTLLGVSRYSDEPGGMALYWQVGQLPGDRQDMEARLVLADQNGSAVSQVNRKFGVPPLEWQVGDNSIEWYDVDLQGATQFRIILTRAKETWQSPWARLD